MQNVKLKRGTDKKKIKARLKWNKIEKRKLVSKWNWNVSENKKKWSRMILVWVHWTHNIPRLGSYCFRDMVSENMRRNKWARHTSHWA